MDQIDIELRKHKFICFVVDHYTPLGVVRSLGEKGIMPIVILVAEHPCMINHSKYVSVLHHVKTKEEGYKILIEKYSNESLKPFVFCGDDVNMSFLDSHYDELKDHFICYNAGEQGRLIWLQNKDNITNLGAEAGLDVPKKEVLDTGVLPKNLKYPVITKVLASTMGGWKNDVHICHNEQELIEAYKVIKSPKLCMQEYINKVGEFCMEGFSCNDGNEVFMPYAADYIRYYNNSYGHYMNMIPFKDEDLKAKINRLFKLTRYNGIFEIEFMKGPDGKNYFLEINFRASTWNYAPTVGGGNLPYFWAKSMLSGSIPYDEMRLRKEPFRAMVEPEDFLKNVLKYKRISLFQWIRDVKSCECYYYYNKYDKAPFYYAISRLVSVLFKRAIGIK